MASRFSECAAGDDVVCVPPAGLSDAAAPGGPIAVARNAREATASRGDAG